MNTHKLKNLFFILLGFVIGQGSFFVLQSYLVLDEEFALITDIGITFGFLSLIQWISDGGGVFILSKRYKSGISLNEFIKVRFIFCVFLSILIQVTFECINYDNVFVVNSMQWSFMIPIIWSFNLTGLADAQQKNKFLGAISGLPYLLCSIYIFIFTYLDSDLESLHFSIIYTFSILIIVLIQFIICDFQSAPNHVGLKETLVEICYFNFAYFSSQIYGRIIPIFIESYIGKNISGFYIYAKSIISFFSQLVTFTRRVEFDSLVGSTFSINNLIKKQIASFAVSLSAILFSILLIALYNFFTFLDTSNLDKISIYIFYLSLILLIWTFSSLYGQFLIANSLMRYYAVVQTLTSAASIFLIFCLIPVFAINSVFVIEAMMLISQIIIYNRICKKCMN